MSILFLLAIAMIFGFLGGKAAQKFKLPGVLGYLLAGLIFGPSFLNVFHIEQLDNFSIFPSFALSLIAFIIGSEMKLESLKELGKGIGIVTILESFGAFLVVCAGVYFLTGKLYMALIFGALAPASAPAGTVAVLHECKSKGRLTNALYAVVGLDDGLAIMIFAVAVALAKILFTGDAISTVSILEGPVFEIISAIVVGCIVGIAAGYFTRKISGQDNILAVTLAALLLCTGVSIYFHFSLILANLSLGMTFVNVFPFSNRKAYQSIQSICLPIYIIFFFLAGAHLQIKLLPSMGLVGLVYVICRITGLMGGAYIGSVVSSMSMVIRKYLGFGILSQAGVAIGLAFIAAGEFSRLGQEGDNLSIMIVNTIAATTIFFEIIGPIGTKFAITKAGEAGVNITEEDLIETYKVSDVMSKKVPVISAGLSLRKLIKIVSDTDSFYYPVVDNDDKIIGAVTLDGIRNTFSTHELNDWLVALDVTEPIIAKITADVALSDALSKAKRYNVQHLPVVSSEQDDTYIGLLDNQAVQRSLSTEVLSRQQKADSMHAVS